MEYVLDRNGNPTLCVACGKPMELGPAGYPNHHCSRRSEGAHAGANTRAHEPLVRNRPFAERLNEGFSMLKDFGYNYGTEDYRFLERLGG